MTGHRYIVARIEVSQTLSASERAKFIQEVKNTIEAMQPEGFNIQRVQVEFEPE